MTLRGFWLSVAAVVSFGPHLEEKDHSSYDILKVEIFHISFSVSYRLINTICIFDFKVIPYKEMN